MPRDNRLKPTEQSKLSAEVIETSVREKHNTISLMKTPTKHKERRPDGFDYVTPTSIQENTFVYSYYQKF